MLNATRANATLATSANATQKTTQTHKINTLTFIFTSTSYSAPRRVLLRTQLCCVRKNFSFLIYQAIFSYIPSSSLGFHFIFGTPQSLKKSNTTLVGPSPAPGSWMHRLRRSMPSCKTRNSASFAASLVGALHVFLCFFHADFWHSALQK